MEDRKVERTIIIDVCGGNSFDVYVGDRATQQLTWNECVGEVAALTHHALFEKGLFRMSTAIEREQERERHQRIMSLNEHRLGWRDWVHHNGAPMYTIDGVPLDTDGKEMADV